MFKLANKRIVGISALILISAYVFLGACAQTPIEEEQPVESIEPTNEEQSVEITEPGRVHRVRIYDITLDRTSYLSVEKPTVSVTLKNVDIHEHGVRVHCYLDTPGGERPWKEPAGPAVEIKLDIHLKPGDQKTILIPIEVVPGKEGIYDLSVLAGILTDEDVDYQHGDFTYAESTVEIINNMGESTEPDTNAVAIIDFAPEELSYEPGDKMPVAIALKNLDIIEHNATIQFYLDATGVEMTWQEAERPLASSENSEIHLNPGEQRVVLTSFWIPGKAGDHYLSVLVNILTEEGNYEHSDFASSKSKIEIKGGNLEESYQPDTDMVAIIDIISDKISYKPGEEMTVAITLKNIGAIDYYVTSFVYLDAPGGALPWGEAEGAVISAPSPQRVHLYLNQKETVSISSTIPDKPGTYDLSVSIVARTEDTEYNHSDFAYYAGEITIEEP